MIIDFSIANTYSIREKQTISFEPTSYDESEKIHYIDAAGTKLLKAACVYGANAAGKSNIALALRFYLNFMVYSFYSNKPDSEIPFVPFLFTNEDSDSICGEFDLNFFVLSSEENRYIKYSYHLKLNRKKIVEESLSYYPKNLPRQIFNRTNDNVVWGSSVKGAKKSIEDIIVPNCTVISASSKTNLNILKDVFTYVVARFNGYTGVYSEEISQELLKKLDEDEVFNKKTTGFLSYADFGSISDIKIKTIRKEPVNSDMSNNEQTVTRRATVFHHYNDKDYPLPLGFESSGTLRMLELVEPLVNSCTKSMAIIDELESSLHQDLVEAFLRLFLELSSTSQMLFTTHNQELLDSGLLLDDEVWFCGKTDNGNSVYDSISDYTGLRKETSRKKLYQAGKFGALPNIDIQKLKDLFNGKSEEK
ncbi:MAG: ATP-binding protein [Treponema sp.]|nr:ATP-binding protein [Treponema sp.]